MTSIQLSFCKGENNEEFSSIQTMLFRVIVDTVLDVLNSGEFKETVEDFYYTDEFGNKKVGFSHSDGYSTQEIYFLIMQGSLKATPDNVNLDFLIQPCEQLVEEHASLLDGRYFLKVGLDCLDDYVALENRHEAIAKTSAFFIKEYLHLLGFKSVDTHSVPEAISAMVETQILENYSIAS